MNENLEQFIVNENESIRTALKKINKNSRRIVFCVNEYGRLTGVMTDGDFRRALLRDQNFDLDQPCKKTANNRPVSYRDDNNKNTLASLFNDRIFAVPVTDKHERLISIAWNESNNFKIGGRQIGKNHSSFLIAEIGNNHNGDLLLAKELIDQAAKAGADCVKFQMRNMETLYGNLTSHQKDLGTEYTLDLLKRFQLTEKEMLNAFDYARSKNIIPLCTPWDIDSLEILDAYGMASFKIASADMTNPELIKAAISKRKPILISTGMATEAEIIQAISQLKDGGAQFGMFHTNSTYPAPMSDINLKYMAHLRALGSEIVGYSGHELGYEICVAAVALGANMIEKHFTVDKKMEGVDHKVSLLPSEFAEMSRSIRNTEEALGSGGHRQLSQGEVLNRENLAKSIFSATEIKAGQMITESMLTIKSPGIGIQPNKKQDLIGRKVGRNMQAGEPFFDTDLSDFEDLDCSFSFRRPWGVPVRYHDFSEVVAQIAPSLVEFHFSYRDLEVKPADLFVEKTDYQMVVHSPELFENDHILDLASMDNEYRKKSVYHMQHVIDRTIELKEFFPRTLCPPIIVNVGGASDGSFIEAEKKQKLYEILEASLTELDPSGVEIIPQTMPPFPWHFGGRRYHNLFVDPDEIKYFCENNSMKICFDVAHSKLACNHQKISFDDFVKTVAPHTRHIHVVDAKGDAEEGLQIGDGEVNFLSLGSLLNKYAPEASFIPEIWQGHKNAGRGFRLALSKLQRLPTWGGDYGS